MSLIGRYFHNLLALSAWLKLENLFKLEINDVLSCDSSFRYHIQDCYCFSLVYTDFAMIYYPEHYKQSFIKYKLK